MQYFCAKIVSKDADVLIVAVQSVTYRIETFNGLLAHACAFVSPYAVLVCGASGHSVFDADAKPISVDHLRQDVPNLDTIVMPLIAPHKLTDNQIQ